MNEKYRFDHKATKHRKRSVIVVLMTSLVIIATITGIAILIIKHTSDSKRTVNGPAKIVGQALAPNTPKNITVTEPDYSFQLPADWHPVTSIAGVTNGDVADSKSWQSSGYVGTAVYISIYEDAIPTSYPVNGVLPLTSLGNRILYGTLSGNCDDFTTGSSTIPTSAVWESVDFLCNLPDKFDNQIGTGSAGEPINTVLVTGPTEGTHTYFFLYIDRSADPSYTTFYNILSSFRAK